MKCVKNIEIQVLHSGAGYYLGTMIMDEDMGCEVPNCRVSSYFKNYEGAKNALDKNNFIEREAMENNYCSGGNYCIEQ